MPLRSYAQLPPPATPSQFDIVGFLQEASVASPAGPTTGGRMKVSGHVITVPDNTIVILPANALTNTGNGSYTLTLVGAPQQVAGAVLQVKSNTNGSSPLTALSLLRT